MEHSAAYLNTGTWASKAIKEAKLFGTVHEVASSKDQNFCYIPKGYSIPEAADYFHCTSNNTIFGTQIHDFPKTNQPLVCDMSSDIFSRVLDYSQFDLIYAGAQKNMGPAGTTLVVIKNEILGKVSRNIPSMLDYQIHIDKQSMYNTPPVLAVHVSMLTLKWLKSMGGVTAIEALNKIKSDLVNFLEKAKKNSKHTICYGAPAKGNTLLNYCKISKTLIDYTVDKNPSKQGLFLPGTHIPIFSPEKIIETKPDFILILPWNLQNEIMEEIKFIREWGGKFVIPIPEVKIL